MSIDDVTFVVTDTETTGAVAGHDRMIEIGAVKIRGGQIVDRFSQLVNPGCAVPRRITRLTGISTSMVFDQPPAASVLPDFIGFLSNGVFVAHNLAFDRRVINDELLRAGLKPMNNEQICTLKLARRMLPGLRSRGLSSLVDFFSIDVARRHRALDDAEATGHILMRLLSRLSLEKRSTSLTDLLHLQHRAYGRAVPQHIREMRSALRPRLPRRPGVYFMKDCDGRVIYVGKAKSLRNRVMSYFNSVEAQPARIRQMLDVVRDVSWEETPTELEALLAESRLIKELRPRFNRALKRYATRPFIRVDVSSAYPTVSSARYIVDDRAEYYGPVQGQKYADWVVDLIGRMFSLRECDDGTLRLGRRCFYGEVGRCLMPCEAESRDDYDTHVQRVRDFLQGKDLEILDRLEQEMLECAKEEEFEEARLYRDSIERLQRLISRSEMVAAPVFDRNAVLVLPETGKTRIRLYFIRFGRLVRTMAVSVRPTDAERRSIRFVVDRCFGVDQDRPERYMREEIDEVRILANWVHGNRRRTDTVHWQPGILADEFVSAILDRIAEHAESEGEPVTETLEHPLQHFSTDP